MELSWLESLFLGFVIGLTEILPVSAQAHKALLNKLFGGTPDPLMELLVHSAVLIALYFSCRDHIGVMLHEQKLMRISKRRRKRHPDMKRVLELRLLKMGAVVLVLSFFLYPMVEGWRLDLSKTALLLVLNGLILYIPMHMAHGNKDARSLTRFDGMLMGLASGFGILPGLSRVGCCTSVAVVRGVDKTHSLNWALLLSIPAMVCLIGLDGYAVLTSGFGWFSIGALINGILAAATAFAGAYTGILLLRYLAKGVGFSGFSYYCWGAALFTFIMYLTI